MPSITRLPHHLPLLLLLALAIALTGCCAADQPGHWDADVITIYSIDGNPVQGSTQAPAPQGESFHGHPVLGKAVAERFGDQQRLRQALQKGIEDNKGMVAGCFIPRHGIRFVKGDKTVDYVICFQCMQVVVHEDGKTTTMLTTESPQKAFDEFLKTRNIPLAK